MPVNEAKLKMINKSTRYLTVKVMKGTEKKAELHQQMALAPKADHIFTFTQTGKYYVKSMAVKIGESETENDTLFSMGKPFQVTADPKKGYSMMKMKYMVKESKRSLGSGSIPITKGKFNEN